MCPRDRIPQRFVSIRSSHLEIKKIGTGITREVSYDGMLIKKEIWEPFSDPCQYSKQMVTSICPNRCQDRTYHPLYFCFKYPLSGTAYKSCIILYKNVKCNASALLTCTPKYGTEAMDWKNWKPSVRSQQWIIKRLILHSVFIVIAWILLFLVWFDYW